MYTHSSLCTVTPWGGVYSLMPWLPCRCRAGLKFRFVPKLPFSFRASGSYINPGNPKPREKNLNSRL